MEAPGITIIGNGNVAWHLAAGFHNSGVRINKIIGRNFDGASELARNVNTTASDKLEDIPGNSELVLICVTDSAIAEIADSIDNKNLKVAHVSGSMPLSVLGESFAARGVLYPFQTFTKHVSTGKLTYPVCVEAENQEFKEFLVSLSKRLTNNIVFLDSNNRRSLHIAGVITNNFSNHLFALAFDYLEKNNLSPQLLVPLLEETVNKLKYGHPRTLQTGPAVRNNRKVLEEHLELLKHDSSLAKIYNLMTQSINAYYKDLK